MVAEGGDAAETGLWRIFTRDDADAHGLDVSTNPFTSHEIQHNSLALQ
jgi:hypothetical protein